MQIPNNTLSASQVRMYGSGGFRIEGHEAERGCPRRWKARYVDGIKETGPRSYELTYGSFFHDIMFRMEEDGLTPEQAIEAAYDPATMDLEMWKEALADLDNYMARDASPSDRYGVVAVEQDLKALLYVDEDFGEIYYRGFLDVLGIDVNESDVLHVSDYKTNRTPPRFEDIKGDIQLLGYTWLALQLWSNWLPREPRVVTHLDVTKFRDVPIEYTRNEIEQWHSWMVAVARKILRDDTAEPILNPGCGFCHVRDTCPAFNALPSLAETLQQEGTKLSDPIEKLKWRDKADALRKLLEKGVKAIDEEFNGKAQQHGQLIVGDQVFSRQVKMKYEVNLQALHAKLGDDFYKAVTTSKTAVERVAKDLDPSTRDQVMSLIRQEPEGTKIVRSTAGSF